MDKENKFKLLKLPSFITSSCKTQNLSQVIDHKLIEEIQVTNEDQQQQQQQQEKYPFCNLTNKPKKTSSTSMTMCKPMCPQTFDQAVRENCTNAAAVNRFPRRKIAGKESLLSPSGGRCPPASPASPLSRKQGKKKELNAVTKDKRIRSRNDYYGFKNGFKTNPLSFSSSNETDDHGDWFSSDDEREDYEKQTMFSLKSISFSSKSISLSSDDSDIETQTRVQTLPQRPSLRPMEVGSHVNLTQARTRTQTQSRNKTRPRRRKASLRPKEVGVVPLEGKVKDTFAIVKSSSDPYSDFRTSMVEMIIEKQIFGAKELEMLLECFISLNSSHHHRVILDVFTEICDALFSH